MNIQDYCSIEDDVLSFSRQQASEFAKRVAGDFNPIHDIDAKRFCVPGDLLFSIVLNRYGVAPVTTVNFEGMVGDGTSIQLPHLVTDEITLADDNGREFLNVSYQQAPANNPVFIEELTRQYVAFSGQTFPDILVSLMQQENVMINPARPLVIYKSMRVELDQMDGLDIQLELDKTTLAVDGKKGEATLEFVLKSAGQIMGRGQKIMLLGGLRDYDQDAIDAIVDEYRRWQQAYHAQHNGS